MRKNCQKFLKNWRSRLERPALKLTENLGTSPKAKSNALRTFGQNHSLLNRFQKLKKEIVVQQVRAPPCQDGSCGFESRQSRCRCRSSARPSGPKPSAPYPAQSLRPLRLGLPPPRRAQVLSIFEIYRQTS